MQRWSILTLVVAALLLGAPSLGYPWTLLDSPLSTYIGQVILEGGLPYHDAWDVRAPGVFFAYALQILLFGKSAVGLRIFDLLWQLATALVLARITLRVSRGKAVELLAGLAYLLLYFSQNFWNWGQPDTFLSLPLALSFLFLLRGFERQTSAWFLAALFVGVATLFKLPFGLFGVILLFAAARTSWPDSRRFVAQLLGLASGFAVPLIVCGLYFAVKGGWKEFLETQLVFAPAYVARIHEQIGFRAFLDSLLRPVVAPLYVMAVLGAGWFFLRFRSEHKPQLGEKLVIAWLGVTVTAFFLHGSFLGYHYAPFFAPVAILFGVSAAAFVAEYRARRSFLYGVGVLLAIVAMVAPLEKIRQHTLQTWQALQGRSADTELLELGEYIRRRTTPEDRIFVWGNAPAIYLYADRKAASRFLCTAYLIVEAAPTNYPAILLEELNAVKPKYFVLYTEGAVTPALLDSMTSFRMFPALQELLARKYTLERETALCQIYRRNP